GGPQGNEAGIFCERFNQQPTESWGRKPCLVDFRQHGLCPVAVHASFAAAPQSPPAHSASGARRLTLIPRFRNTGRSLKTFGSRPSASELTGSRHREPCA